MTESAFPKHYTTAVPLRWSDLDINGHVNNARVITLIEEAKLMWLSAVDEVFGLDRFLQASFVANVNINYRRSINYGSELTIEMTLVKLGTSSIRVGLVGRQAGEVVFDGSTIDVNMGASGTSAPLIGREREVLEQLLVAGE